MNFLPPYSTKREEKAICERKVEGDDGSSANERRIGGRMSGEEEGREGSSIENPLSLTLLSSSFLPIYSLSPKRRRRRRGERKSEVKHADGERVEVMKEEAQTPK